LFVTIPFAAIADRGHRRAVLCLNVGGLTLMYAWLLFVGLIGDALPTRAMLFAPFLSLLGGGDCVINTTVAAFITELAIDDVDR
jgi:hypothetical protein